MEKCYSGERAECQQGHLNEVERGKAFALSWRQCEIKVAPWEGKHRLSDLMLLDSTQNAC
jgi:hypothetical protein